MSKLRKRRRAEDQKEKGSAPLSTTTRARQKLSGRSGTVRIHVDHAGSNRTKTRGNSVGGTYVRLVEARTRSPTVWARWKCAVSRRGHKESNGEPDLLQNTFSSAEGPGTETGERALLESKD